jgi:hypothetical protein
MIRSRKKLNWLQTRKCIQYFFRERISKINLDIEKNNEKTCKKKLITRILNIFDAYIILYCNVVLNLLTTEFCFQKEIFIVNIDDVPQMLLWFSLRAENSIYFNQILGIYT